MSFSKIVSLTAKVVGGLRVYLLLCQINWVETTWFKVQWNLQELTHVPKTSNLEKLKSRKSTSTKLPLWIPMSYIYST